MHTLQTARTAPAARANPVAYQRAVDEAARTYLEGGGAPLRVLLGQDSAMLSTLANVDAPRLERDLTASFERQSSGVRSLVTGVDAGSVAGIVESVASDRIRLGIVQEAQVIVTARVQDLRAMRGALPELLPALRNARPGTPEAIQAQALGIRGDEGDLGRAREAIQEGIEGLQTFMGRTRGQAWWQASDFPAAAERSGRRANLGGSSDSPSASAGARGHDERGRAPRGRASAEVAHIREAGALVVHAIVGTASRRDRRACPVGHRPARDPPPTGTRSKRVRSIAEARPCLGPRRGRVFRGEVAGVASHSWLRLFPLAA
ncbi:MAG: hypothetical protein IPN77_10750 [Sandaracinaceae bacterium]|nr:hypothetical protein [Sandaracinaceae bacterium]